MRHGRNEPCPRLVNRQTGSMPHERRSCPREPIVLKFVTAGGQPAQTRDITPKGLYLQLPLETRIELWMSIELEFAAFGLQLRAIGEVVRLERVKPLLGVALRLHSVQLTSLGC